MSRPDTLIDTCCLINLCAVADPETVLPQIPFRWYLSSAAAAESISIRPSHDAKGQDRRRINLEPCFNTGILSSCTASTEAEQTLYVELAQEVDDGEAMSLAIASIRGWGISTDDLAARRIAKRLGIFTTSTPELLKLWAENSKADAIEISKAIKNVETLARYSPRSSMPCYEWWCLHRS